MIENQGENFHIDQEIESINKLYLWGQRSSSLKNRGSEKN